MKLSGWSRIMVVITVAWLLVVAGLVNYEYKNNNVFCQFDGDGAACQHILWAWVYVKPEKFEFTLMYGRLLTTALIPTVALWFSFGAAVWVGVGFKGKS